MKRVPAQTRLSPTCARLALGFRPLTIKQRLITPVTNVTIAICHIQRVLEMVTGLLKSHYIKQIVLKARANSLALLLAFSKHNRT